LLRLSFCPPSFFRGHAYVMRVGDLFFLYA